MRPLFFLLAIVLAIASVVVVPVGAPAGWGPHGCAAVAAPVAIMPAADILDGWQHRRDEPHMWGCFIGGKMVASYNAKTHIFRAYDADRDAWGVPAPVTGQTWLQFAGLKTARCSQCGIDGCACKLGEKCPGFACPTLKTTGTPAPCADGCGCERCEDGCKCGKGVPCHEGCPCITAKLTPQKIEAEAVVQNFGVDLSKLRHHAGEEYRLNGVPVSEARARMAMESYAAGGTLPDDAKMLRLTVIGSDADRARVLADVDSLKLREQVVVQDYPPEHWAVKQAGFVTNGAPTIYLQAPDGKVLHRQDRYESAAQLAGAVRKAKDGYDPKKDPDLNKMPGPKNPDKPGDELPWPVLVGGGLMILLAGLLVLKR